MLLENFEELGDLGYFDQDYDIEYSVRILCLFSTSVTDFRNVSFVTVVDVIFFVQDGVLTVRLGGKLHKGIVLPIVVKKLARDRGMSAITSSLLLHPINFKLQCYFTV